MIKKYIIHIYTLYLKILFEHKLFGYLLKDNIIKCVNRTLTKYIS